MMLLRYALATYADSAFFLLLLAIYVLRYAIMLRRLYRR